ncbi:MAG: DUF1801 domain-containing protein [Pedosphaera sp.]|nr:DUF1801 domain-containing protein [Pedosphaera sp.]
MKAPAHITTPDQYIAALPEPRRAAIQTLHNAIRKAAPSLKSEIGYGMLAYGPFHTTYASGREVDTWAVCLASQKNYISLYVGGCLANQENPAGSCENKSYLPDRYLLQLGKVSVGKACIRFKKLEDLNLKVAMELVKKAAQLKKQPAGSKCE